MIPSTYTGEIYGSTDTTATTTTGSSSAIGQDAFMKMFMAQVTNQNPLDPMDNTEFTAQLATFSQLEKLTEIAESMEGLAGLQQTMDKSVALSYLGKEVTVGGNVVPVVDGKAGKLGYALDYAAEAQAVITDEAGVTVATVDLGTISPGQNYFTWDGKNTAGEAVKDGAYTVTIEALSSNGETVEVYGQTVTAKVTGYMEDTDGTVYLLLGDAAVKLSGILAVNATSSADTTDKTAVQSALDELNALVEEGEADESSVSSSDILKALGTLGTLGALLL